MKRITKLMLALAVLASPLTFTSCDDDPLYDGYYYNELVTDAVNNYRYTFPNGSDYYTAYNWFYYHYPDAYTEEFYQFMDIIGSTRNPYWNYYNNGGYSWNNNYYNQQHDSQNSTLVEEAQTLCGEWEGNLRYEYTDDKTKQRVRDEFTANMKFFQYNSSSTSLSGNGVEVDTDAKGNQQTLDFSWYVDKDGDIYIKYTKKGTIFVLDLQSKDAGFHLGYEKEKGYDTFFGTAFSTNTEDVMYLDLARQQTSGAKAAPGVKTRASQGKAFGNATQNNFAKSSADAVNRLHER